MEIVNYVSDTEFARYYNKLDVITYRPQEIFMPINIPDCQGYMVSDYGRVFYPPRNMMVTPYISRNGYLNCKIYEVNKAIHRLVLETFCPVQNYIELDVNHIDGVKTNNRVWNLEWTTRSENIIHAFSHNLSKQGEDHPNSVYTTKQIENICKYLSSADITDYNIVSCILERPYEKKMQKLVYKLRNGKAWKPISRKYGII